MSERYSRQIRFAPIGEAGQKKIRSGCAAIVGTGALGTAIAEILARAGVGKLVLIDRDVVEESNLQRQFLFDSADAKASLPKAEAARKRLAQINPEVQVEAKIVNLLESNAQELLRGANVILDGSDNFPTRYVVNDTAIALGVPWIYGAAVGSYGLTLTCIPKKTACLRCVFPEPPDAKNAPTCQSDGVLASVTAVIGAMEAAEALKILSGRAEDVCRELRALDLWQGPSQALRIERRLDCESCGDGIRKSVSAQEKATNMPPREMSAESLCGRNAVQLSPLAPATCDLAAEAARLAEKSKVIAQNKFLLKIRADGVEASLFPDGRVIVWETSDVGAAKAFYERFFATEKS